MDGFHRNRPVTRSAALFALAALVSLSVAVPGGAQAQMVGGQAAAASHLIDRLNEAARTLAGARDESETKPSRMIRPDRFRSCRMPARPDRPPVDRGDVSLGHRMDLTRLYLPPPASR